MKTLRKALFISIAAPLIAICLIIYAVLTGRYPSVPSGPASEAISMNCTQGIVIEADPSHPVVGSRSVDWVEKWRFQTARPAWSASPTFRIAGQKVIVWYPLKENEADEYSEYNACLIAFDLKDGRVLWQTLLKAPDNHSAIIDASQVDLNTNQIYLSYAWRIQAINLSTGNLNWYQILNPGGHVSYYFDLQPANPLVIHVTNRKRFELDPLNGEILATKDDLPKDYQKDGVRIEFLFNDGLKAYDLSNGQMLWERPEASMVFFYEEWLEFIDEDIIYSTGRSESAIFRVDRRTGQLRWLSEYKYISKPVLYDDQVWSLYVDGYLVALDAETGQAAGWVKFDRPFSSKSYGEFSLAVEGPYLAVYLRDSQELVVFQR